MCFFSQPKGPSASDLAAQAAANKPAPLPSEPVRADETRIQNTVAALQGIRRQSGRSGTILTGGGGAMDYGLGGTRLGG